MKKKQGSIYHTYVYVNYITISKFLKFVTYLSSTKNLNLNWLYTSLLLLNSYDYSKFIFFLKIYLSFFPTSIGTI